MKWSAIASAVLLAAAPLTAAPQQSSTTSSSASGARTITLQGCVAPGVDKDQVVVTNVSEKLAAGQSALPPEAHGRKVIFWLDQDAQLKAHVGHMVEVSGTQGKIEKSEIEVKPGHQKDGSLVVEFEGPGHDVKASTDVVGQPLGTSGRVASANTDIPTFLVRVKVDSVLPLPQTCR